MATAEKDQTQPITRRFVLCAEDVLSAALARDLCDRVVYERARAEWLRALWAPTLRETQRRWTGLEPHTAWSDRHAVDRAAQALGVRSHVRLRETGRLRAMHGAAATAFKALRVAAHLSPPPDLVVLAGDTEGIVAPDRLRAEGVATAAEGIPSLVAEHHRESEAWVVLGFVPRNHEERARLVAVTRSLGFDPTEEPHRLLAGSAHDPRDAKRVCRLLLGVEHITPALERVRSCWLDTPLDRLEAHGEGTGLVRYLRAVETVLLPLLGDG